MVSLGRIALQRLDPFDSLRSLRVTVVGRTFYLKWKLVASDTKIFPNKKAQDLFLNFPKINILLIFV